MTLSEIPFNKLPLLPPRMEQVETLAVLRQVAITAAVVGELKGLASTLPNPNILLNAVILKEATASSEIENIITTQDKLYQALTIKTLQTDAATKEVLRYREALLTGFHFLTKHGFISTNAIIQIQQVLEENSASIRRLPGTALKNAMTGATIYTPPDDYDTIMDLMQNLEDYIHEENGVSPYIKMAVQHYQFESIHPFYDGNGRTGRILNVLFLILKDCLGQPILYHSKYIIENKADYYRLLQEVRTKENWEDWILFMAKGVEETAKQTIGKILQINELFQLTLEKIKQEKPKVYSKEFLELLFVQPYCRIETVVEHLGITRPTASRYLNELAKLGILRKQQVWKETLFIHQRLSDMLGE